MCIQLLYNQLNQRKQRMHMHFKQLQYQKKWHQLQQLQQLLSNQLLEKVQLPYRWQFPWGQHIHQFQLPFDQQSKN